MRGLLLGINTKRSSLEMSKSIITSRVVSLLDIWKGRNPLRRKSPSDGRLLRVWGQARCVDAATGFGYESRKPVPALGHRRLSPVKATTESRVVNLGFHLRG